MMAPTILLGALAVVLGAVCNAGAANADTFRVLLGGRTLGTLETTAGQLRTLLDNTPLGVADGTFAATSDAATTTDGRSITRYASDARSGRKGRSIGFDHDRGRVLTTLITPESERTALSDPANVPPDVIDPVAALSRLAGAQGCPAAFRIYDGRRVIEIAPRGSQTTDVALICDMQYRVVAGPGHLSPFRFTALDLTLTYGKTGGLAGIDISTGPFRVSLRR